MHPTNQRTARQEVVAYPYEALEGHLKWPSLMPLTHGALTSRRQVEG